VQGTLAAVPHAYCATNGVHCALRNSRYGGGEGTHVNGVTLRDALLNWMNGKQPTKVVAK
jgi:hypothetical protein